MSSALLVIVLVGWGLFLRPTWLAGGDTSNLVVSGHSMDGTYRTGDLVVVKAK
jgi:signal peptidase I